MRMKLLRLLRLAPLALLLVGVASAQTTGTIIGVVTDAQSGKPMAGALVVATSSQMQGEQTVVTDKGGAFRLQALPPGEYKLAAQFDGYKTAERSDLTVRLDKTIRANLALVPEAVQLDEQVVKTVTVVATISTSPSNGCMSLLSIAFMTFLRKSRQVFCLRPVIRASCVEGQPFLSITIR